MDTLSLLFPKARKEILRLLFGDLLPELHLRDLARMAHLTAPALTRELSLLQKDGLVASRRDGNRLYFKACPQHPFFPDLRRMVEKSHGIQQKLKTALADVAGIRCAFIFGSIAANTASVDSDIDILIIGTAGLRAITPALRSVASESHREINPRCLTPEEWRQKKHAGDAFAGRVEAEPKLWLKGGPDELAALG
ncbi:MAG: polymerase beta domain protein region [Verrucomicrobiales bacterium]|nr:polymerase beta domain protein region [Verrucomicrobiales bacterium]